MQTWAQVFPYARGEDASFTDVKIKPQIGNRTRRCEWRHAPEVWAEDFEIWKKSISWVLASEKNGLLSGLAEARPVVGGGVLHAVGGGGGRWKSHLRKIVYLSPFVEKPFNSKGNKKFRTWTKKSWVFFVFWYSYVIYIWVMNILGTFHIFMYGYVTSIATALGCKGELLLSLDCSTYSWSVPYKGWVLSKEASSTIFFLVFGITQMGLYLGFLDCWQTPYPLFI